MKMTNSVLFAFLTVLLAAITSPALASERRADARARAGVVVDNAAVGVGSRRERIECECARTIEGLECIDGGREIEECTGPESSTNGLCHNPPTPTTTATPTATATATPTNTAQQPCCCCCCCGAGEEELVIYFETENTARFVSWVLVPPRDAACEDVVVVVAARTHRILGFKDSHRPCLESNTNTRYEWKPTVKTTNSQTRGSRVLAMGGGGDTVVLDSIAEGLDDDLRSSTIPIETGTGANVPKICRGVPAATPSSSPAAVAIATPPGTMPRVATLPATPPTPTPTPPRDKKPTRAPTTAKAPKKGQKAIPFPKYPKKKKKSGAKKKPNDVPSPSPERTLPGKAPKKGQKAIRFPAYPKKKWKKNGANWKSREVPHGVKRKSKEGPAPPFTIRPPKERHPKESTKAPKEGPKGDTISSLSKEKVEKKRGQKEIKGGAR